MKIFFLFLGLLSNEPGYELLKIPITQGFKKVTCDHAFEKYTEWKLNPNYEDGNGEVWGFHTYKDKVVFMHYCKDKQGNWVR